jgi:HEAT repeat protein
LRQVCSTEIAKLEREVASEPPLFSPDPELLERVRGIVLGRAHEKGKLRALGLKDLASIGPPTVPILDALVDEQDLQPEARLSALEALGAIDDPRSADALVRRVDIERVREAWIRAQCAFQLANQTSDHILLPLLAKLKYETDGETVIWIAAVLAKHANFAGFDGLRVLSASAATPEVSAQAQAMLVKLTQDAGFGDPEELYRTWLGPDETHRLPREEPSDRLLLDTWHRIGDLAQFDLRIVDDARFALSRSSPWVVALLSAALHDENTYVRAHVAQVLERMGTRASSACSELRLALDEPRTAAAAATALASIGCVDAVDSLLQCLQPKTDAELRNAAAAALGRLGTSAVIAPLRALLATSEPLDLRQAAAQSLLAQGDPTPALPILIDCLVAPGADAGAAEIALQAWLERRSAANEPGALEVLTKWKAIAGDSIETPPPAKAARRQRAHAELLRSLQL